MAAATNFVSQIQNEIDNLKAGCGSYENGVTAPYQVNTTVKVIKDEFGSSCPELPDFSEARDDTGEEDEREQDANNEEEIFNPYVIQ
jgi:hypothetical protein